MEFFTSIKTAFAIKSYYNTLKDYFDPLIRKTRKRINNEYFKYDMGSRGDLLFWRDVLKEEFNNPYGGEIEKSSQQIRVGDIIELNNSNISRWVPFFPGKRYSKEGMMPVDKHNETFPQNHDLDLEGKLVSRNNSWTLSGSATVRALRQNPWITLLGSIHRLFFRCIS